MRFNKFYLLTLLCIPLTSYSTTWEALLKSNVDQAYTEFNEKIAYCNANKQPLKKITDDWFIHLSKNEKLAAASYIQYLADKDCWGDALTKYESALLSYAAESNDKKQLNERLYFSKVYRNKMLENTFKNLDVSELMSWYEKEGGVSPFDFFDFLIQYPEFQHPELKK
ncbi:hypothetical protein VA7868_02917 [Vibrio aerogenes CECT 7868]|uniref:Lysozyme inhibitor LprI N-terminal domain-containing protein n=2 Tax=Vibrio aerogenes TaxID=92172 RepID=A0A1M5ZLL6_9VIBR|nr:hypothetical protein VA7868_02917 [Vibrio aerogenes CECT 7868]